MKTIWNKKNRISVFMRKVFTYGTAMMLMLACGLLFAFEGSSSVYAEEDYKPLRIEIGFECMEDLELPDGTYRIGIRAEDKSAPQPDRSRLEVTGGQGSFHITVDEPGTYVYLVSQEKGSDKTVVYDKTTYEIHIFVVNKEENTAEASALDHKPELDYTMTVNYAGTDEKPGKLAFLNKSAKREKPAESTEQSTEPGTDQPPQNTNVRTGDSTPLVLLIVILCVAFAGIAVLLILKYKNRKDDK